jgi:hypothetical protein
VLAVVELFSSERRNLLGKYNAEAAVEEGSIYI